MRQFTDHGTCSGCGAIGPVWVNRIRHLDLGAVVLEPDTTQPPRCDTCEVRYRVERDYAADPVWARRVWGSATAEGALRLLGLE